MSKKFSVLIFALFLVGCDAAPQSSQVSPANNNQAVVNSNSNSNSNANGNSKPAPPKNPQTPFENALFSIRVGDFEQVLVFRRKDEGVFTEEDKEFLRQNQSQEIDRRVNRWIACDDGKCFIAGTNFEFSRENLIALQNRFDIKDYSKSNDPAELVLPLTAESK